MADPGFPVGGGGVGLVGGGVDSQGGYMSKILYVKMKDLGPLGGARPPRSANDVCHIFIKHHYEIDNTSMLTLSFIKLRLILAKLHKLDKQQ